MFCLQISGLGGVTSRPTLSAIRRWSTKAPAFFKTRRFVPSPVRYLAPRSVRSSRSLSRRVSSWHCGVLMAARVCWGLMCVSSDRRAAISDVHAHRINQARGSRQPIWPTRVQISAVCLGAAADLWPSSARRPRERCGRCWVAPGRPFHSVKLAMGASNVCSTSSSASHLSHDFGASALPGAACSTGCCG